MATSTAMSNPAQMSLSFATDNLVVLSFLPEVILHRLYLFHMMGWSTVFRSFLKNVKTLEPKIYITIPSIP